MAADPRQRRAVIIEEVLRMRAEQNRDIILRIVEALNETLAANDAYGASKLFGHDCFWRDIVALTWNFRTSEGRDEIRDMLAACLPNVAPVKFCLEDKEDVVERDGNVEAILEIETKAGRGAAHVRLRGGKIFTLMTALNELKGHQERSGRLRPLGAEHGVNRDRKTWLEGLQNEFDELGYARQPYCLVVGGGQGGIVLGARLRQLGVPTIIADRHERPGDNWRKRYKSLCLHDPVWYDHLPYIPFPDSWPVFSPKDKIADWLESYTKLMELNYWSSTDCLSASFSETDREWRVVLRRDGEEVVVRPKHLVLATGLAGRPRVPRFRGQEDFKGEVQHSSQHTGPDHYNGKQVVVIGSNNSAHDICAALWEAGADVTMVQRSSTHIVQSGQSVGVGDLTLYSQEAIEAGITTEKADLMDASFPYAVLPRYEIPVWERKRKEQADYYGRLEKVGFQLDFGEDGSGIALKYLRRASGYYIDVGASELIMNGDIKLKSGVEINRFTETGVLMADGTELPADLVVLATGYETMNCWVADLISQDVADKVGKVWGLGSGTRGDPGPWEGELRNMWKPTQQEGLWFQGGNLHQTRHYSQFLALQLKARMEGLETPVYRLQPSYHRS